jgi:hypothetical protein
MESLKDFEKRNEKLTDDIMFGRTTSDRYYNLR